MAESLWFVSTSVQLPGCALLFVLALWRGAAPERVLSGALLAAVFGVHVYDRFFASPDAFRQVDLVLLLFDLLLTGVIILVALRANRVYPLWMGGAQLAAMGSHLARASLPGLYPWVYIAMDQFPNYLHMTALALGLAAHARREKQKGGPYPSWIH